MGSEWSTDVGLLAETWPDRARPIGCGLLQSGFGWGNFVAAVFWLVLNAWNPLGGETWRLMFVVGALPALFMLYIRRNVGESERWLTAIREQRWNTTEGAAGGGKRPFTLTEVFREKESRRRVLLAFLLSLATHGRLLGSGESVRPLHGADGDRGRLRRPGELGDLGLASLAIR
jgi:MFS family permease